MSDCKVNKTVAFNYSTNIRGKNQTNNGHNVRCFSCINFHTAASVTPKSQKAHWH